METLLRLAFHHAGLPTPMINRPLIGEDGRARHVPDFQWPQYRVCAEYDGNPHDDPEQVKRDIRRARSAARAGFTEVRLFAEDTQRGCIEAIRLIRAELLRQGWEP